MKRDKGFTLAELLIALAVLGVIATFTIPKVLQAQQDARYRAIGKEAAGTIFGAYHAYLADHRGDVGSFNDQEQLTPYLNYVRLDTSTVVDSNPGYGTNTCAGGAGLQCYQLHNGAIIYFQANRWFCPGVENTALEFAVDPDGKASDYKAVTFFLYRNGRFTTRARLYGSTELCGPSSFAATYTAWPMDPDWFGWN